MDQFNQQPTTITEIKTTTKEKKANLTPVVIFLVFLFFAIAVTAYIFVSKGSKNAKKAKEAALISQMEKEKTNIISIKTDKEEYTKGETITINIIASGQGEKIDGAEFVLNFDPQLIKIDKLETSDYFSTYLQKKIDNEKGTVRVTTVQKTSKDLETETIATLLGTTLKSGKLNLEFDKQKTKIAGYGGINLLKDVQPLTIKIK